MNFLAGIFLFAMVIQALCAGRVDRDNREIMDVDNIKEVRQPKYDGGYENGMKQSGYSRYEDDGHDDEDAYMRGGQNNAFAFAFNDDDDDDRIGYGSGYGSSYGSGYGSKYSSGYSNKDRDNNRNRNRNRNANANANANRDENANRNRNNVKSKNAVEDAIYVRKSSNLIKKITVCH